MDGRGVYMLGATTYEAVETQISFNMRCAHEDDWQFLFALDRWPEVSRRLAALGIVPDPSKADRNYDGEHGRPVLPAVPEGWRHIPSADGVGVLAPASQFHPSFPHVLDDPSSPASALEAATSYAAEHFSRRGAVAVAGGLLAILAAARYRHLPGDDRRLSPPRGCIAGRGVEHRIARPMTSG